MACTTSSRVSDDDKKGSLDAGQALHIEPGLFMYVPPNDNSGVAGYSTTEPTIVRMGSIPHGVNVLMQGTAPSPRRRSRGRRISRTPTRTRRCR